MNKELIMKNSGLLKKKSMVEKLKKNLISMVMLRRLRRTNKKLLFSKNKMTQRMDIRT
jgi:hypothetical protein